MTKPAAPARDCGEPFCGDGVIIDPSPDVLGRQADSKRELDNTDTIDERGEEHVDDATRNVSLVNMKLDAARERSAGMDAKDRLKKRRVEAGFTVEDLAVRVGMAPSTVRAHENGQNGVRLPAARRYARALSTTPEWIMFGTGPEAADAADGIVPARTVPVLGQIQAGAFIELPEDPEPQEFVPFSDPRYARATVYALRVIGTSMDQFYPNGATVYVVPAPEAGVREGDHVVVRREKSGLFETTLKEIIFDGGKLALRPRSSDPAHQAIIRLGEAEFPEIIAVVVGTYIPAVPRSGHIVMPGGF